jgi:hypothetical protein
MAFNDLTGKKFGDLRVIAYAGVDKHRRRRWRVSCERCGYGVKVVLAANLLSGRTKTCGCVSAWKAHLRMKTWAFAEMWERLIAKGMTFEEAQCRLRALMATGMGVHEAYRELERSVTTPKR